MKKLLKIFSCILVLTNLEIKSIESIDEEKIGLDQFFEQEFTKLLSNSSISTQQLKTLIEAEIESQALTSSTRRFSSALSLAIRKGYFKGLTAQEIVEIVRDYYLLKCESGQAIPFIDVIGFYDE